MRQELEASLIELEEKTIGMSCSRIELEEVVSRLRESSSRVDTEDREGKLEQVAMRALAEVLGDESD